MPTVHFRRLSPAVAGVAAALLTGATLCQGDVAQAASAPAPAPDFVIASTMRTADGLDPMSIHSPAPGELWMLGRTADMEVAVARKVGSRWERTVLTSYSPYIEGGTIVGTPRNMWVAANSSLWHYDGRRWKAVEVPVVGVKSRYPVSYFLDVAPAPGGAYVVYALPYENGLAHQRVGWTDGKVLKPLGTSVGQKSSLGWGRLRSQGGVLYAERMWLSGKTDVVTKLTSYDGVRWRDHGVLSRQLGSPNIHDYVDLPAWAVTPSKQNVFLGFHYASKPVVPFCRSWTPRKGFRPCTTTAVGAAATALRNNRIVAGSNAPDGPERPDLPVTFYLRDPNGKERRLTGERRGELQQLTAEPVGPRARTQPVWALSRTLTKQANITDEGMYEYATYDYTIQRYEARLR
ncbi:MAG: hypothetical protein Q4G51_01090 [Dermatophilus congolensis]|nr:hypothetical protein [Dermatophilus congolensis]